MFKDLLKAKSSQLKARYGFTLIEILIVVAIIAILASVVIVGLGPVQKKGRDARKVADLKEVQTGLELYYSKNGNYPDTGISSWDNLKTTLIGAGISVNSIPVPPSGGSYCYASDGTTYVIATKLEDTENIALKSSFTGTVPAGGMGSSCTCGSGVGILDYCVSL